MGIRRVVFDSLRVWQKLFGAKPVGDFLLLSGNEMDTEARLNWYLVDPNRPIYSHPAAVRHEIAGLAPEFLTPHPRRTVEQPPGRGHKVLSASLLPSVAAVLRDPAGVTLVSPSLYGSADSVGYLRVRSAFAPSTPTESTWPLMHLGGSSACWAVLAATGPSADGFDYSSCRQADLRIICNSAVRDEALLAAMHPNIVCFGDPVFHFGPSEYASAFRADLARACAVLPDLVAVVPEHFRELLLTHLPQLRRRVYGLTLASVPRGIPDRRQSAATRRTGNVLTQHLLPVALQFSPKRLSLIGCDGRKRSERYFWSHGKAVQYSDHLMNSVFEAHPSFFRDVSYANYYKRHCDELEGWVRLAESQGASVDTLTPSFIPVLKTRLVPA